MSNQRKNEASSSAALKVLEIEYDWRYYPGLPKPDEK